MQKFEEFDEATFPAEECTIQLSGNSSYFRSDKLRTVIVYDINTDSIILKNLYPCVHSFEDSEEDEFGFCTPTENEFYRNGKRYKVKGFGEAVDIAMMISDMFS